MNVSAVILAAGNSSRMGTEKLLLEIDGRSLLHRAIAAVAAYPLVVVTSPHLRSAALAAGATHVVENAEPEQGMAHSARLADAAIGDRTSALLLLPADLPFLQPRHVEFVLEAAETSGAEVVRPVRKGVPGHPVFFGVPARHMLRLLPDGDTLRSIYQKMASGRCDVETDDDAYFLDVDTPEDFQACFK
ncbi:MAG TPA: nucleotidyltransferase family protein [Candidatus Baltobacteraceae bacterium]|nr:nucleotidyltransferase family protein [Candidatus Baltobacteraceae bacterium]